jgi:hypothetical protein
MEKQTPLGHIIFFIMCKLELDISENYDYGLRPFVQRLVTQRSLLCWLPLSPPGGIVGGTLGGVVGLLASHVGVGVVDVIADAARRKT